MECIVEREIDKSRSSQDIKVTRARQAHYIQWCIHKGFKDPVGPEPGWRRIISVYIKYVMIGVNYNNLATLRSATCKYYAEEIKKLFEFREFSSPGNFQDKTKRTMTIINNLKRRKT